MLFCRFYHTNNELQNEEDELMKENTTTIFYFPLGTPYFPKTDLRLERAKWTNIEDLNGIDKLHKFLEIHMGRDDGYYGYYPVYSRPICNGRLLNIRQIGFIDSQDSIRSIKTFGDLRQHMDYYIVANSFKSPKFRRAVNVHSLTNIVVDIDVHHARGGIKGCRDVIMQRLDALLYLIFVKKPIGLPCPNTVVHTGRGIQLWWTIKPLSAKKLKYIYKGIQEYLFTALEKEINSADPELKEYVLLDISASKKMSGLFRLPGTWNTRSKTYGDFWILHDNKLDAAKLYFALHPATGKPYIKYKKKKKQGNPVFRKNNYGNHIDNMIRSLIELRRSAGEMEDGYRDLYCLIVLSAYLSNDTPEDEAWNRVVALNNSFKNPLPEKELRSYMSTAMQKKYKYRNETIIGYLGIDDEEQKALGFYPANVHYYEERQKARERGQKRRKMKEKRDIKIIELFAKGVLQEKIAELVGCAQSTVSKILKAAGITKKKTGIKKAVTILCQKAKKKCKKEVRSEEKLKRLAAEDPEFAKTMERLAELKESRKKYERTKAEFTQESDQEFLLMGEEEFQYVIQNNCEEYNHSHATKIVE